MQMIRNYLEEIWKMLSNSDSNDLTSKSDPYLLLRGAFLPGISRKLNKDCLTIRKKSAWENSGYKITIKKNTPEPSHFTKGGYYYYFDSNLNLKDERIIEAIDTGKKIYTQITDIIQYLKMGYTIEDFITLPEDLKLYAEAGLLYHKYELDKALSKIKQAISINQYEIFYEFYFQILLELKQVESFKEYIDHYQNNYDRIIDNETLFKWLKILLKQNKKGRYNEYN